eukprot:SAG22_NODE_13328_length_410_cov_0.903537_1_plen_74_part_01
MDPGTLIREIEDAADEVLAVEVSGPGLEELTATVRGDGGPAGGAGNEGAEEQDVADVNCSCGAVDDDGERMVAC